MKNYYRLISKIDIKNEKIVKGINLEGLRSLGDPLYFSQKYYAHQIDEIIIHDITASLYKNVFLKKLLEDISKKIFIPITAGGGVRSLDDIENLLSSGADRVLINTALFDNINFLRDAVKIYGKANIVINIEYSKIDGENYVFCKQGREKTNYLLLDWIKKLKKNGAGEIVLTSIDNDGTGKGFDLDILKEVAKNYNDPVSVHGGCGRVKDIKNLIDLFPEISGIILSSLLHYNYLEKKTELLKKSNFDKINIKNIKKKLNSKNRYFR